MQQAIAYLDLEITQNGAIADIGCITNNEQQYHGIVYWRPNEKDGIKIVLPELVLEKK